MRYLVGIPCLFGAEHTQEAIESVVNNANTDVLLIDNGAETGVKYVIDKYVNSKTNVFVINNKENIYVNPAWNQIINFFLNNDYDYLLIMNSDLILQKDWKQVLDFYLEKYPELIPVPVISHDKSILKSQVDIEFNYGEVFSSTAGVCIVLSKEMANKIYPIPEQLKVWFGDNWIYDGLRKLGYRTFVLNNFISYHSGSQNVSRVKGISEIIEQDKIEWEKLK